MDNLYVHFPFCRRKCSYCALYSRAGSTSVERDEYVRSLVDACRGEYKTVYFGGGSPGLCDLGALLEVVRGDEFTVELHPLDVSVELLRKLRDGGVNRISMGVQSLDDAILAHMGRGYGFVEAEKAFGLVREFFDNAGIDLIVGYPGEKAALTPRHARLVRWGLRHCSVYLLQNERHLANVVDDETALDRLGVMARFLDEIGLKRYEISNYAVPGYECRHNLAVWRGEDYRGVGKGACGREGLLRTRSGRAETVSAAFDEKERRLFRLRTREGLDATGHEEWRGTLENFERAGLLRRKGSIYTLTDRGMEVCDSILAELA